MLKKTTFIYYISEDKQRQQEGGQVYAWVMKLIIRQGHKKDDKMNGEQCQNDRKKMLHISSTIQKK